MAETKKWLIMKPKITLKITIDAVEMNRLEKRISIKEKQIAKPNPNAAPGNSAPNLYPKPYPIIVEKITNKNLRIYSIGSGFYVVQAVKSNLKFLLSQLRIFRPSLL